MVMYIYIYIYIITSQNAAKKSFFANSKSWAVISRISGLAVKRVGGDNIRVRPVALKLHYYT